MTVDIRAKVKLIIIYVEPDKNDNLYESRGRSSPLYSYICHDRNFVWISERIKKNLISNSLQ